MAKKIKDENGNVYVKKTPFYKKWWFILIVIIVVFGVVKGGSGSNSTKQEVASSSSTQTAASEETSQTKATEKNKNKEEETKAKAENKIGEVVKVGDVEYIVNSKSLSQNVGGEFGKNANGIYLILNVTVKNNGKKSITVTDDFFKLLKDDTEYSTDSTAGIYANQEAKFFLSELNPENSITGNVVFDVNTETADASGLQLQVQTGVFGTQRGKISLD
ncbi:MULTISPECIES: DUF4352 domain-containing protein [Streptococcus]|uniref:DUF4352 domain-containing protein n=1 Tax=Streptococcus TaxID=1301 RepID=UPI00025AB2B7|nr:MULTISPECIES: DUF4352 domain-containing protein [Streptococcus]EID29377.1 telomeric repeat-binding factor 2 [Streptococcus pseudopneumoniae ATCC BAA-960 = CCUG 49455]MBF9605399.1 DUF4352 domain-containing protein [Streptococcus pseudopneumoniae]MBF9681189.1 DUF4352 domain-containing protein [Streptococcus pseudopneumoniae]MDS9311698.1 DUF4352 domain-containing protein [Streptococcus pseudopneumoniae]NIB92059.1 DUF4352 domain-containing protein [Streptococcus pseudopneumoniae]